MTRGGVHCGPPRISWRRDPSPTQLSDRIPRRREWSSGTYLTETQADTAPSGGQPGSASRCFTQTSPCSGTDAIGQVRPPDEAASRVAASLKRAGSDTRTSSRKRSIRRKDQSPDAVRPPDAR
jgi:hypothetical protein